MKNKDILSVLMDIYNLLLQINVHGSDVVRMAQALHNCDQLLVQIQKNINKNDNDIETE